VKRFIVGGKAKIDGSFDERLFPRNCGGDCRVYFRISAEHRE
jgi:hypothetical protein